MPQWHSLFSMPLNPNIVFIQFQDFWWTSHLHWKSGCHRVLLPLQPVAFCSFPSPQASLLSAGINFTPTKLAFLMHLLLAPHFQNHKIWVIFVRLICSYNHTGWNIYQIPLLLHKRVYIVNTHTYREIGEREREREGKTERERQRKRERQRNRDENSNRTSSQGLTRPVMVLSTILESSWSFTY